MHFSYCFQDVSFNSDAHTEKHTPGVNSRNDFSLLEEGSFLMV